MPSDDVNKRRAIINIFVQSIYLYDDHFTLIINASKKPLSIDNIPLDDIETAFEGEIGALEGCSSLSTPAPPCRSKLYIACSGFLQKSERAYAAALSFSIEPTALGFDFVLDATLKVAASIVSRWYKRVSEERLLL